MFDDIAVFIRITQCRGLAAAAAQLQLPAATVTRRLQRLENTLGCRLIHRSARQFKLTSDGEVYYQAYAELVHQLHTTARDLNSNMQQLSGRLKVLAPSNISAGILQPMWTDFMKSYPNIELHLELNNSRHDLNMSQADIALRIGPQPDSSLYQKRLGSMVTLLVAAPQYLEQHGDPQCLEDLPQHRLISITALSQWSLRNISTGKIQKLQPKANAVISDVGLASSMVADGLGIALLPLCEIHTALQHQHLVRVLPNWQGPDRDIYAVWPSGRMLSAKAKCLRDFMHKSMENNSVLQGSLLS